jgi:hypothetical protein
MAATMAGFTARYTSHKRPISDRRETSVVTRYLPLIVSGIAVAIFSFVFYHEGEDFLNDKWIALEISISLILALSSAIVHTRVWSVRNAGTIWLLVGTLMLYGGIGAQLWNMTSGVDGILLAIMRGALVVSGPLMIYGVIEYNRRKPTWEHDQGVVEGHAAGMTQGHMEGMVTGRAEGVAQEQFDQHIREESNHG